MTTVHLRLSEEIQLGVEAGLEPFFDRVAAADEASLDLGGIADIDPWLASTLVRLARQRGFSKPAIVLVGLNPIVRAEASRSGLDRIFRIA